MNAKLIFACFVAAVCLAGEPKPDNRPDEKHFRYEYEYVLAKGDRMGWESEDIDDDEIENFPYWVRDGDVLTLFAVRDDDCREPYETAIKPKWYSFSTSLSEEKIECASYLSKTQGIRVPHSIFNGRFNVSFAIYSDAACADVMFEDHKSLAMTNHVECEEDHTFYMPIPVEYKAVAGEIVNDVRPVTVSFKAKAPKEYPSECAVTQCTVEIFEVGAKDEVDILKDTFDCTGIEKTNGVTKQYEIPAKYERIMYEITFHANDFEHSETESRETRVCTSAAPGPFTLRRPRNGQTVVITQNQKAIVFDYDYDNSECVDPATVDFNITVNPGEFNVLVSGKKAELIIEGVELGKSEFTYTIDMLDKEGKVLQTTAGTFILCHTEDPITEPVPSEPSNSSEPIDETVRFAWTASSWGADACDVANITFTYQLFIYEVHDEFHRRHPFAVSNLSYFDIPLVNFTANTLYKWFIRAVSEDDEYSSPSQLFSVQMPERSDVVVAFDKNVPYEVVRDRATEIVSQFRAVLNRNTTYLSVVNVKQVASGVEAYIDAPVSVINQLVQLGSSNYEANTIMSYNVRVYKGDGTFGSGAISAVFTALVALMAVIAVFF